MESKKVNKQIIANILTLIFSLFLGFVSKTAKAQKLLSFWYYLDSDVVLTVVSALLVIVFTRWIEDIGNWIIYVIACIFAVGLFLMTYCCNDEDWIHISVLVIFIISLALFIVDVIVLMIKLRKEPEGVENLDTLFIDRDK